MPNRLPPSFGTDTDVTNYFVLTYDTAVLACAAPKASWDGIMSLSLGICAGPHPLGLLQWGRTPVLFVGLGFCPQDPELPLQRVWRC